jgi:hypothetical protein
MLDDAWDDAPEGGLTLRNALRAKERAAGLLVSGGSLSSVSKNSASQSYAFGSGAVTATDIARGWRILIDLYDSVVASSLTDTDNETIVIMRERLVPIREFTKDFSGIGFA